jgi:hypothetical protein
MAGPALADAIAALVLGDLLKRSHAELLYGPWFNLIGAPPLPEADDVAETVSAEKATKAPKVAKAFKGGAREPAASGSKSAKAVKPAAKSKPAGKATTASGDKPASKPTTTVKSTKK